MKGSSRQDDHIRVLTPLCSQGGRSDAVEAGQGQLLLLVNYCSTRKAKKQLRMYFCTLLAVVSSGAELLASGKTAVLSQVKHLAVVSCAVWQC